MSDMSGVLADVRRRMIPAHVYNDREIFELEKETGVLPFLDVRGPRVGDHPSRATM